MGHDSLENELTAQHMYTTYDMSGPVCGTVSDSRVGRQESGDNVSFG